MREPTLEVGAILGRYEVVRFLGAGGMGEVYEARHMGLKKRVALKILFAHLVQNPKTLKRFLREGEAASRVRHPHIVDVTDVGVEEGTPYLVMEYLEGEDLAARIGRGRFEVPDLLRIMLPVIAGVAAAHRSDIIHRDLKPENIFLALDEVREERPVVLDFGVSKLTDDPGALALTASAALVGTPYYISPEQARGAKAVDARADQYAVGVILYEALSGRRPYQAESLFELIHAISRSDFPRLRDLRSDLPEELEEVILEAMAREPAERYRTLNHLGEALLPFADEDTAAKWAPVFDREIRSIETTLSEEDLGLSETVDRASSGGGASGGGEVVVTAGGPRSSGDRSPTPRFDRSAETVGSVERPGALPVPAALSTPGRSRSRAGPALAVGAVAAVGLSVLIIAWVGGGSEPASAPVPATVGRGTDDSTGPADTLRMPPGGVGPLRFGVGRYLPRERGEARYGRLVTYLSEALDRPVEMIWSERYDDVSSALVAGETDLGMVSSFWYVRAGRQGAGVRLLGVGATEGDTTSYEGIVVARAAGRIHQLDDLRARVFCYVTPSSSSGYLYPRALLRRAGIDPDDGFRTTRFAGGHIEALQAVDDGVCDGAAVAGYMLERHWAAGGGDPEAFRVLARTGRIPYDAVAARSSLPEPVLEQLRDTHLALPPGSAAAEEVLGDSPVRGYVPIEDSDYEAARALSDHLEQPPPER